MMKNIKIPWLKYGLLVIVVVILGLSIEFMFNAKILSLNSQEKGIHEIPMENLEYQGFVAVGDRLVMNADWGFIRVPINGTYVDRFLFGFDYDGLLNLSVFVSAKNEYGEYEEYEVKDRNSKLVGHSYIKIGSEVEYISLVVNRKELEEPGLSYIDFNSYKLSMTRFAIQNIPRMNQYRLFSIWCLLFIGGFLLLEREWIAKHIEVGFLAVALPVGCLMVLALPANKVSWDEEIHFERAFWMANYPTPVKISDSIYQEFFAGVDTWPFNLPDSYEEQEELNQYLNETADYQNGAIKYSSHIEKSAVQGYLGQAIVLKVGQLFGIPFGLLFKLGRLGNLIMYCVILFFAIRIVPVGKCIMAVIGLMPTPLFLASVYSYDPSVTAFLYLALAMMLKEILTPQKKITWKSFAFITIAFLLGCRAKAVYAPLIFIALLLPKTKFVDKRQMYIIRSAIAVIFLWQMSTFILPIVIAPKDTGDLRGGATSEIGQMSYILGNPIAYAKILITSIWETLPDYLAGKSVFGTLGHLGISSYTYLMYILMTVAVVTDTESHSEKTLTGKQKIWIFVVIGMAAVLVWTSMYIAYTVPGSVKIEGVQGRYYLPLLFPLYMILNSRTIINRIPSGWYAIGMMGVSAIILLLTVYEQILFPYCL